MRLRKRDIEVETKVTVRYRGTRFLSPHGLASSMACEMAWSIADARALRPRCAYAVYLEHMERLRKKAARRILPIAKKVFAQEYVMPEGSWPWCYACKSYHHPKNPTCIARKGGS